MATIGTRIRARRTELGWTQDVLAEKAGISKSFLSDLENDKRSPGATNLYDISTCLSVSMDYLLTGRERVLDTSAEDSVAIPSALSAIAKENLLSFRQTLVLLDMQKQILAHRSETKGDGPGSFDWHRFYMQVKEFIE